MKKQYRQFLDENFKGLVIKKPLFYNWKIGLRFDLELPYPRKYDDPYFEEVVKRSTTLFETAFDLQDEILLVYIDFTSKRSKIPFSNYLFSQIKDIKKSEVSYKRIQSLYYPENIKVSSSIVALIKLSRERLNYKNILTSIANIDYGYRKPRLNKRAPWSCGEVHFINLTKKIIFNMYDNRGLDIIGADIEILRPIYLKHNDLILEYDREEIDKKFE